jgi:hypothetical protein
MHTATALPASPRHRRMRGATGLAPLIGLALLVAACGGGKSSATATATTAPTATPAATTPVPSAVATAGGGSTSGAATAALSAFCGDWSKMLAEAATVTGSVTSGTSTSLKDDFTQTGTFIQALSDHAPAEIKPDFEVYAKFWQDFSAAMAKADYDVTKIVTDPSLLQAFQSLNDPSVQQATQHIDAWIQKNCGTQ